MIITDTLKEDHESYQCPVDGWSWFDTKEAAYAAFGVALPEDPSNLNA